MDQVTSSMPTPRPRKTDPFGAAWPDLIPLRPLRIGEIFGAAAVLVRRNFLVLGGLSLIIGLLAAGAEIAFLANRSDLNVYLTGSWAQDMVDSGSIAIPPVVLWPMAIGILAQLVGTTVVSSLATVYATELAIGKPVSSQVVKKRLSGRWWIVFLVAVVTSLMIGVGFALLIFPGLLALATLSLAVPVAVIEGGSPLKAVRRSIRLSSPVMWRILGIMLLTLVITAFISMTVSGIVGGLSSLQDWTSLVTVEIAVGLLAALLTPWAGAVAAVLYIDTRIRNEGLAEPLRQAAERARQAGTN